MNFLRAWRVSSTGMLKLRSTLHDLQTAAALLRSGQLVAFPTETVYGLGAIATDASAVARIFQAKNRPKFDPLIVHTYDRDSAGAVGDITHPILCDLVEAFWPGPLTIVVPKKPHIPDLVTAGLSTVGIRVPANTVARELLHATDAPIAAPSANRFGALSPTRFEHVMSGFRDAANAAHHTRAADGKEIADTADIADIAAVIDGGPCEVGVESTIVRVSNETEPGNIVVLRAGGVSLEDISRVIGSHQAVMHASIIDDNQAKQGLQAPGQLAAHYAPTTPIVVFPYESEPPRPMLDQRMGVLTFRARPTDARYAAWIAMSESGEVEHAAAALFERLHELDEMHLDYIAAELAPERGIGRAMNDRLRRGAASRNSEDWI